MNPLITYEVTKVSFSRKFKVVQFTYTNTQDPKDTFTSEFSPAPQYKMHLHDEHDESNIDAGMEQYAEDFLDTLYNGPDGDDPNHKV